MEKRNTVSHTTALLRFLSDATAPMGVNAISRELDLPPSTCFRILKQLAEDGYAHFDSKTKCYSLGGAVMMLARRVLDPANTFGLIQPHLAQFVAETETSIGFWSRIDRNRLILAGFLEAPKTMRIHMSVGQRLPLFIGAIGRAFAGEMQLGDADIKKELTKLRWDVPPSHAEYVQQVRDYRRLGYSVDAGNFASGVTTVATVLCDASGNPSYGLTAMRISSQISDNDVLANGAAIVRLKQNIHRQWSGTP